MEKNNEKLQAQMHAPNYFFHLIKEPLSLIPPRQYHNLQVVQGLGTASLCVLPGALVSSTAKSLFAAVIVSALSETGREQTQAPSLLIEKYHMDQS